MTTAFCAENEKLKYALEPTDAALRMVEGMMADEIEGEGEEIKIEPPPKEQLELGLVENQPQAKTPSRLDFDHFQPKKKSGKNNVLPEQLTLFID
jgi:hypothetical protein